jgi:hypothetical protein
MEGWWNDSDRGIPNYLEQRLPSATSSTTHLTQTGLISNMGPPSSKDGDKPPESGHSH